MFSLRTLIFREKHGARPAHGFKVRLWQVLDAALPPISRSELRYAFMRKTAIGFAIILPFLLGSTTAYAYNSPSVTEGSVLYPMKRGIETIQIRFARTPSDQAVVHIKMYSRRLDEAERLLNAQVQMMHTLQHANIDDEAISQATKAVEIDAVMRAKFSKDLQKMRSRYETVRHRVHIDVPDRQNRP